ncbi:lisH domain-containing protein FOPNL [Clonorchis sinensis]|uniref:LisH domain-containing protein FOPNL n=1 Tax=Clonorchis sinensis TaxID=79923 RepID=G7YSA4_CLOSI|nr:lisH domain-containing protein FOPNL [Clonorchis sinensis]
MKQMSSVKELKDALRISLEKRGILKSLKSELLSRLFETLDQELKTGDGGKLTALSDTKFLIHELILEFLSFENLHFSRSTFCTESGHGDAMLSRQTLCQTLQIRPTVNVKSLIGPTEPDLAGQPQQHHAPVVDKPVPLLYYIVNWLKDRKLTPPSDARQCGTEHPDEKNAHRSDPFHGRSCCPAVDESHQQTTLTRYSPNYSPCMEQFSSEGDLY